MFGRTSNQASGKTNRWPIIFVAAKSINHIIALLDFVVLLVADFVDVTILAINGSAIFEQIEDLIAVHDGLLGLTRMQSQSCGISSKVVDMNDLTVKTDGNIVITWHF
jgi:hypothetical protein